MKNNISFIIDGEELSQNLQEYYIDGFKVKQTCLACPEQYDFYFDDIKVGYLRLRNGNLKVEFKDEIILVKKIGETSVFSSDERVKELDNAVKLIKERLINEYTRKI
jgi:hypothetical protein